MAVLGGIVRPRAACRVLHAAIARTAAAEIEVRSEARDHAQVDQRLTVSPPRRQRSCP